MHDKGTVITELPIETEEKPKSHELNEDNHQEPVTDVEMLNSLTKQTPENKVPDTKMEQFSTADFLNEYMNKIIIYMVIFVILTSDTVKKPFTRLPFINAFGEVNKSLTANVLLSMIGALLVIYAWKQ